MNVPSGIVLSLASNVIFSRRLLTATGGVGIAGARHGGLAIVADCWT